VAAHEGGKGDGGGPRARAVGKGRQHLAGARRKTRGDNIFFSPTIPKHNKLNEYKNIKKLKSTLCSGMSDRVALI
jgi:hypothetical protein